MAKVEMDLIFNEGKDDLFGTPDKPNGVKNEEKHVFLLPTKCHHKENLQ
jgi:hypothetical protein